MNDQPTDSMMEKREELMIPPLAGGKPTFRTAYFLNPTDQASIAENLSSTFAPSVNINIPKHKKIPLKVKFWGWKTPQRGWSTWLHQLKPLCEDIWKKAGIFDAILSSTYQTSRDNDLIIKLAEKWCVETNTFMFSWGEATITLEDMMVLGGYSVLGDFAFSSPDKTEDMFPQKEKLRNAHRAVRECSGQYARANAWMHNYRGIGGKLEHQAFLVLWLSRYVFHTNQNIVRKDVFPIAVKLSRGIPIALAPTVLAGIYRDMGLLKNSVMSLNNLENCLSGSDESSELMLSGPLHLVQLWAWERFPTLRPNPNPIEIGEPRIARWHQVKKLNGEDVRKALDTAGEDFQWRPYTTILENWNCKKFYKENQQYVLVDSELDCEVKSVIRCLRNSELVGIDCIELYSPHRVAMQFGFDQDVPFSVKKSNEQTPESAWRNYSRPFRDASLYLPARLFEPDVTKRYLDWWDQMKLTKNTNENVVLLDFPCHSDDHVVQQLDEDYDNDEDDNDDEIPLAELVNMKRAHRNHEIRKSGGAEILADAQNSMSAAENCGAVKATESLVNNLQPDGHHNLGRVLKKCRTDTENAVKGKERSASIDENEEVDTEIEAADDDIFAGVESLSEIAEISDLTPRALPKKLYRIDEHPVKKLEARIRYLERMVLRI